MTDTARQFEGIHLLVGTLCNITCLDAENLDTLAAKVTRHGARLLKKPLQCKAVAACSHLYWCAARKDGKRVLECLQKCLKILEVIVQADAKFVSMWVDMFDTYSYYFEVGCEEVTAAFVAALKDLCLEHISFAESDASAQAEARAAKAHLAASVAHLKAQKASADQVNPRFLELEL